MSKTSIRMKLVESALWCLAGCVLLWDTLSAGLRDRAAAKTGCSDGWVCQFPNAVLLLCLFDAGILHPCRGGDMKETETVEYRVASVRSGPKKKREVLPNVFKNRSKAYTFCRNHRHLYDGLAIVHPDGSFESLFGSRQQ